LNIYIKFANSNNPNIFFTLRVHAASYVYNFDFYLSYCFSNLCIGACVYCHRACAQTTAHVHVATFCQYDRFANLIYNIL